MKGKANNKSNSKEFAILDLTLPCSSFQTLPRSARKLFFQVSCRHSFLCFCLFDTSMKQFPVLPFAFPVKACIWDFLANNTTRQCR